jgi:hypothetical protein
MAAIDTTIIGNPQYPKLIVEDRGPQSPLRYLVFSPQREFDKRTRRTFQTIDKLAQYLGSQIDNSSFEMPINLANSLPENLRTAQVPSSR